MFTYFAKLFIDVWYRKISVARRAKLIYDAPTIINKSHGTVTQLDFARSILCNRSLSFSTHIHTERERGGERERERERERDQKKTQIVSTVNFSVER